MRILIVSPYYWPEDFGAGVYVSELAEGLNRLGHQIEVITGFPNYPHGKVLDGYRGRLFQVEIHHDVRILRGWFYTTPRTSGAIKRGGSAASFALSSLLTSHAVNKPDVVLGFSPPPFTGLAAWILARRWAVPLLLNVKDLFTDGVVAAGLARPGIVTNFLSRIEHFLYAHSDHVVVPVLAFRRHLTSVGIPSNSLSVIPDWADGDFIKPMPHENDLRKEWGLEGCFVVLYSGNMGYSSDLETVLLAAAELRDLSRVRFVLVGDGVKRPLLEQMAADMNLVNVQFWPLQPRDRFPHVLAAADVALVTLSPQGGKASTQGKLYSLMAAGRPVLAVVEPVNDVHQLVVEEGLGVSVRPGDAHGLAEAIRTLKSDPAQAEAYGRQARAVFEQRFSIEACVGQYERLMRKMVAKQ